MCHECGARCGWADHCSDLDDHGGLAIDSLESLALWAIRAWNKRDDRHADLYQEEAARVDKALADEGVA